MKNNEERVYNLTDEEIIEKLISDKENAYSNYSNYSNRTDLILESLRRSPEMIMYLPESIKKKKSFYDQVKEVIPEEYLNEGYRYTEVQTIGTKVSAIGKAIADKYQEIDDFYMGRDLSSEDIWVERTIALAFTPLPYIHLVTKGVVGIGKGIASLSEYAREKYRRAQLERMMQDEEEINSSSKDLDSESKNTK